MWQLNAKITLHLEDIIGTADIRFVGYSTTVSMLISCYGYVRKLLAFRV